ncbi:uncharacterized protein LOC130744197 [Lotus japonicus]|uniref:uncharacterized protein LOC130744197 n=1 Tax=Lotus japonicus TaxID=34305 RepID=UPI002586B82A|nr:uncharacterized protein LOC130744197 [Lotus japonicus]
MSPGKLPYDTIENQANLSAITTRSGKILKGVERKILKNRGEEVEKSKEENKEVSEKKKINDKSEVNKDKETTTFPNDKSCCKIPFPKALVKKNLEKQFFKFLEVFKKLQINIPFSEALEQMPAYSKFMKEILSRRRKLSEVDETIMMSEECSAILQRKLPQKIKDPGSFTLPVEIEGLPVVKALCDLGASINLMPLTMLEGLGLGEVTPTMINLQLADRSLKTPYGIIEDILVRVDKFIFPVDFVILDMEEDAIIPLILGRPFLATGNAKINVRKGILSLKVGEEKMRFKVFESLKHRNDESIFSVEVVDEFVCEEFVRISMKDSLEDVIMEGFESTDLPECDVETVNQLDSVSSLSFRSVWREELKRYEETPIKSAKLELKPLPHPQICLS